MRTAARWLLTFLVTVVFGGLAEAHTISKTIFGPTDGTVLFTQDFADDNGSILVIYDLSLNTNHSQYDCGIYRHDPTIAKPLISSEGWCADTPTNTATTRIEPASYSFLEPVPGVDCRRLSYLACKAADPTAHEIFFTVTAAKLYSCHGFEPPFNSPILLKSRAQRAIPLRIYMLDSNGVVLTNADIVPPVVNVSFSAGAGLGSDVTDVLSPIGQANDGNQFRFDAGSAKWVFNLGTSSFNTPGTYTVSVLSGGTEYFIKPTCIGQFIRE